MPGNSPGADRTTGAPRQGPVEESEMFARYEKYMQPMNWWPLGHARRSQPLPDSLAAILDRAAVEEQRLTWEAMRQYATAYDLPLEALVDRAWGWRFPYVELVAAGIPQCDLAAI